MVIKAIRSNFEKKCSPLFFTNTFLRDQYNVLIYDDMIDRKLFGITNLDKDKNHPEVIVLSKYIFLECNKIINFCIVIYS